MLLHCTIIAVTLRTHTHTMPPKGKRKRKALDLADRLRVIDLSKKNKSALSVVDKFGAGKTQIQSIIKNKDNIIKDYENNCNQAEEANNS